MKHIILAITALSLTALLCACGKTEPMPTTTAPAVTTQPSTRPATDPTMGTNIPDPSINESVPPMSDYTDPAATMK